MVQMIRLKSHEEWLKHRERIGGSDAAAIVGMNPYKSNVELWQIKTGQVVPEDISNKPYVKYGTEAEQYLREMFKLDFPEYQVEYVDNNMFFNDKYPFAHASLDGWLTDQDGRRGVWECKTTQIQHPGQKRKWDGRIPDNYYIQILHYLMVTEFDFVVLKAQLKYDFGEQNRAGGRRNRHSISGICGTGFLETGTGKKKTGTYPAGIIKNKTRSTEKWN